MTHTEELFIDEMVEQQEFIEQLEIQAEVAGFYRMEYHPFSQAQETKLTYLFESTIAEHHTITEEMIVIVLSDYAQSINGRLMKELR